MQYLRTAGFSVETENVQDLAAVNTRLKVPPSARACHTATMANYLIVGHVPEGAIRQLLRQHPDVAGIAVPGMPPGSPGMDSPNPAAYDVVAWKPGGETFVFAKVDKDGHVRIEN